MLKYYCLILTMMLLNLHPHFGGAVSARLFADERAGASEALSKDKIKTLIENLGSKVASRRAEAQRVLQDAGPEVEDALRKASKDAKNPTRQNLAENILKHRGMNASIRKYGLEADEMARVDSAVLALTKNISEQLSKIYSGVLRFDRDEDFEKLFSQRELDALKQVRGREGANAFALRFTEEFETLFKAELEEKAGKLFHDTVKEGAYTAMFMALDRAELFGNFQAEKAPEACLWQRRWLLDKGFNQKGALIFDYPGGSREEYAKEIDKANEARFELWKKSPVGGWPVEQVIKLRKGEIRELPRDLPACDGALGPRLKRMKQMNEARELKRQWLCWEGVESSAGDRVILCFDFITLNFFTLVLKEDEFQAESKLRAKEHLAEKIKELR